MKRSELKSYPPPPCMAPEIGISGNPACICTSLLSAFFCQTGHMMECHYPMDCLTAKCSHLAKYGWMFEEDQIEPEKT
jgi:hypothetical protein